MVTTDFDYTIEPDAIRLSVTAYNAADVAKDLEVDFTWPAPANIYRASTATGVIAAETNTALPTYRFTVPAESTETLTVEIPFERVIQVEHAPSLNKRKRPNRSKVVTRVNSVLNDGRKFDLGDLIEEKSSAGIVFISTEDSRETHNRTAIDLTETFTFENLTADPISVHFKIYRDQRTRKTELIKSSTPPDDEDALLWKITIPGDSTKTLTTTLRIPE